MPIVPIDREREQAAERGAKVAAYWHGGIESQINLCVGIRDGLLAYGHSKELLDAFLAPFVASGVFTADEALQGPSGSKLSMYKQVGEHERLLRNPQIAAKLVAGYTIAYQVCVVFKNLPGSDEGQKIAELARILADCPDDGAREYRIEHTRRLKRLRKAENSEQDDGDQSDGSAAGDTLRALREAREQFDLLAVTFGDELRQLIKNDADFSMLERCLPLYQLRNNRAAVVIVGRHLDLMRFAERLLPIFGFDKTEATLLVRRPGSSLISEVEAIVVAQRNYMPLSLPEDGTWLVEHGGVVDPPAIAAQICAAANHKWHVFARAQTEGWRCLIGQKSLFEMPEAA